MVSFEDLTENVIGVEDSEDEDGSCADCSVEDIFICGQVAMMETERRACGKKSLKGLLAGKLDQDLCFQVEERRENGDRRRGNKLDEDGGEKLTSGGGVVVAGWWLTR